jgi:hypothetical protein
MCAQTLSTALAGIMLTSLPIVGCVGIPIESNDAQHVSAEMLRHVVEDGWTRDQVTAAIGPPDTFDERAGAVGYLRCGGGTEYLVLPYFGHYYQHAGCLLTGIWFDRDGHAIDAASHDAGGCYMDEWLSKPGGGCPK